MMAYESQMKEADEERRCEAIETAMRAAAGERVWGSSFPS